jgi:DNA polymerase III subunit gamma/tau
VAHVQLCYQIALSGRRDLSQAPDELAGLIMSFLRMLAFIAEPTAKPTAQTPPRKAIPVVSMPQIAQSSPINTRPSIAQRPTTTERQASAEPSLSERQPVAERAQAPRPLPNTREDWIQLVDALPSGGAPVELARHCVWIGRNGKTLQLSLPQANKVLLAMSDRLLAMLVPMIGAAQLDIQLDRESANPVAEQSVAARDQAASQALMSAAEESLMNDPVVQALLASGGRIIPESIKPIKPS